MSNWKEGKHDRPLGRLDREILLLGNKWTDLAGEVILTELRLRAPQEEGGEWFAVIKAWVEGVASVAFISAPDLDTLVHLVAVKLVNGQCKWREDKPYGK